MHWNKVRAGLVLAALVAAPALSWGQATGATGTTYGLQPGLANTPHDFTAGATNGDALTKFVAGTGGLAAIGVCTYCHTPHKAQTTQLLWNHKLSANSFSWTDATTTTAGTVLPTLTPAYAGPSVKCLSCHDGSVAIGDIALFAETPRTGTNALNTTQLNNPALGSAPLEFQIAGANGTAGSMNGNHPVGVPYPTSGGAYNGIVTGTGINVSEWLTNPVQVNNATSNIRLFTQDTTGVHAIAPGTTVPANVGVECSSCHDPHNKQATDDFFLRGHLAGNTTADGYICLQCHQK